MGAPIGRLSGTTLLVPQVMGAVARTQLGDPPTVLSTGFVLRGGCWLPARAHNPRHVGSIPTPAILDKVHAFGHCDR